MDCRHFGCRSSSRALLWWMVRHCDDVWLEWKWDVSCVWQNAEDSNMRCWLWRSRCTMVWWLQPTPQVKQIENVSLLYGIADFSVQRAREFNKLLRKRTNILFKPTVMAHAIKMRSKNLNSRLLRNRLKISVQRNGLDVWMATKLIRVTSFCRLVFEMVACALTDKWTKETDAGHAQRD